MKKTTVSQPKHIFVILMAIALVLGGCNAEVSETLAPAGKLLLVGELETGKEQAFTFDLATGETENLSRGLAPIWSASLHHSDLLFEYQGDISRLNVETGEIVPITTLPSLDSRPIWSPEGDVFAFEQNYLSISLGSLDGETRELVAPITDGELHINSWHPTNGELAYTEYRHEPAPEGEPSASPSKLMVVDSSGNVRELVNLEDRSELSMAGSPAFSPDGKQVAFHARMGDSFHIFVADLSTGFVHELSNADGDFTMPVWSPDGLWIAAFAGNSFVIFSLDGAVVQVSDVNGAVLQWLSD